MVTLRVDFTHLGLKRVFLVPSALNSILPGTFLKVREVKANPEISLKHKSIGLGQVVEKLPASIFKDTDIVNNTNSAPSLTPGPTPSLCSPILAFVKAFRLKSDVTTLKLSLNE